MATLWSAPGIGRLRAIRIARESLRYAAPNISPESGFPDNAADVYERILDETRDAKEELALLRRQSGVARARRALEEMVHVIERHEAVASDLEINYNLHNDLELSKHRAAYFQQPDAASGLSAALDCARDTRATTTPPLGGGQICVDAGRTRIASRAVREAFDIASSLEARTFRERRDARPDSRHVSHARRRSIRSDCS